MAAFGPVISIGSASKPLWGGLRIGWVRADEATISSGWRRSARRATWVRRRWNSW